MEALVEGTEDGADVAVGVAQDGGFVGGTESDTAFEEDAQTIARSGLGNDFAVWRKDSRRRTAGGELRLGTVSYMGTVEDLSSR